jgi:hypothetical protein
LLFPGQLAVTLCEPAVKELVVSVAVVPLIWPVPIDTPLL